MSNYFLAVRGQVTGPMGIEQIALLRSRGQLDGFARVSVTGQDPWEPVDDVVARERAVNMAPPPAMPPAAPMTIGARELTDTQRLEVIKNHEVIWPMRIEHLMMLHYLTAGTFSFFWIIGRHGQLPVTRGDDPSAEKAIGLCFVPFYQLYWFFIVFPRLADRVNAMSIASHLPPIASRPLAYVLATLIAVPVALMTAGSIVLALLWFTTSSMFEAKLLFFILPNTLTVLAYSVVWPIFAKQVQTGINRIFEAQVSGLRNALRQ